MRLLIVGGLSGQLSAAAKIAMDRGAKVAFAPDVEIGGIGAIDVARDLRQVPLGGFK